MPKHLGCASFPRARSRRTRPPQPADCPCHLPGYVLIIVPRKNNVISHLEQHRPSPDSEARDNQTTVIMKLPGLALCNRLGHFVSEQPEAGPFHKRPKVLGTHDTFEQWEFYQSKCRAVTKRGGCWTQQLDVSSLNEPKLASRRARKDVIQRKKTKTKKTSIYK